MFIFYDKYRTEKGYLRNNLFLELKNDSFSFDDKRFRMDVMHKHKAQKFYTLYQDDSSLYILIPSHTRGEQAMMAVITPLGTVMVPKSDQEADVVKIWYPLSDYKNELKHIRHHLYGQFFLAILGALVLSLLAAWYTLRPLRSSLRMLEDFIKDIIHDINTPLTSILLNLKMLESKSDEIESIDTAAKTIEMLHYNLDAYIKEKKQTEETFLAEEVVNKYVAFFTPLYDYLTWEVTVEPCRIHTDRNAFERIVYNLLSNACRYNTSEGKITIQVTGSMLSIQNSSYGVKHPERVFERFYKESDRGLGIGLHIVDKLCRTLGIDKTFAVEGTEVVVTLMCHHTTVSA
jgi:signal transduction histidine kinase